MKVSINLANKFGARFEVDRDELQRKIGAQLGAIEESEEWGSYFDPQIVVAEIVESGDHPDADKLGLYKVNDGSGQIKQVVAGDKTLKVGDKVGYIPPGSQVPSSIRDGKPFTIEERPLRGQVSQGMLGSGKELLFNEDHQRVQVLDTEYAPGTPLTEAYELDDLIVDIENKMFTHRPDCFGIIGVAREISGIQGLSYQSPGWYLNRDSRACVTGSSDSEIKELSVFVEDPALCPRYMLSSATNVTINPSPLWMQSYLYRSGHRPINNVVDITNYIMLTTGQPIHAFDFDKVAIGGSAQIIVRRPKKGEKLTLLGGKEIEPWQDATLICNPDGPIALGGVIGGSNSEVDQNTTRVLIECANFDMYNIRKTSMKHGIFTDAVTRFNKGQSSAQCAPVLAESMRLLSEVCGAQQVGETIDSNPKTAAIKPVEVSEKFINDRLGSNLSAAEITGLLRSTEFEVSNLQPPTSNLQIIPPFWRTDIHIPEDILEEVGRLYGYGHLPKKLPTRSSIPSQVEPMLELKSNIRSGLARAGASEVLTYSFVHSKLMLAAGQDPEQAFKIRNALSPDLQRMRLSLTPNLLEKIHPNIKSGHNHFALFEMGKIHTKSSLIIQKEANDEKDAGLPKEYNRLSLVLAASDQQVKRQKLGAAFYQVRTYYDYLVKSLGISCWQLKTLDNLDSKEQQALGVEVNKALLAPFDLQRSLLVYCEQTCGQTNESQLVGVFGDISPSTAKQLKLPSYCAGLELSLDSAICCAKNPIAYRPLSKFPEITQDVTYEVERSQTWGNLHQKIETAFNKVYSGPDILPTQIRAGDIYKPKDQPGKKRVTFHLILQRTDRTLATSEVNQLLEEVDSHLAKSCQAVRV